MSGGGPSLAVDVVIQTPEGVVLVRRGRDPYRGLWALPGGFVRYGERVEEAAAREAKEETGLNIEVRRLIGVYSDAGRDPRGHVVSICFQAERTGGELAASDDASEVHIFREVPWRDLAFDHARMLRDAGLG